MAEKTEKVGNAKAAVQAAKLYRVQQQLVYQVRQLRLFLIQKQVLR